MSNNSAMKNLIIFASERVSSHRLYEKESAAAFDNQVCNTNIQWAGWWEKDSYITANVTISAAFFPIYLARIYRADLFYDKLNNDTPPR